VELFTGLLVDHLTHHGEAHDEHGVLPPSPHPFLIVYGSPIRTEPYESISHLPGVQSYSLPTVMLPRLERRDRSVGIFCTALKKSQQRSVNRIPAFGFEQRETVTDVEGARDLCLDWILLDQGFDLAKS
jgi:hypothetical protein